MNNKYKDLIEKLEKLDEAIDYYGHDEDFGPIESIHEAAKVIKYLSTENDSMRIDWRYWLNSQNIQLHAGEMTKQEMRSVKAVLNLIKRSSERKKFVVKKCTTYPIRRVIYRERFKDIKEAEAYIKGAKPEKYTEFIIETEK